MKLTAVQSVGCQQCCQGQPPLSTMPEASGGPSILEHAQDEAGWLVIVLVGEDGKGIPGEPFLLRLQSGDTLSGRLDRRGRVRIEGLPTGTVQVSFPERDAAAWSRAESHRA